MKRLPSRHRSLLLPLLGTTALGLLAAAPAARAQTPGDQDSSFAVGPSASAQVEAVAVQSNGQVLAGGDFTTFRGANRPGIARLNTDGSLDSFDPGLAISGYNGGTLVVAAVAQQPADGYVIAAGIFNVLGQTDGGGVARFTTDGTLDSSFNVGSGVVDGGGVVGQAECAAVLPNGQILVGGSFHTFNGAIVAGIVRLNSDGSVDTSFNPGGLGINANDYGEDVKSIVVLANGQIYIGGHFSSYDNMSAGCVARLNADGTLDTSFDVGTGADYGVNALAVQADGKVLVGGGYNDFDGISVPHLVRLNTDGSLDTSYYPITGYTITEVDAILAQPDGTALIGGVLYSNGGLVDYPVGAVLRILADGTQDGSFDGTGVSGQALALALQSDGNALVAANTDALVGAATGDVLRIYDLVASTPTVTVTPRVTKASEDGTSGPATFIVSISVAPSVKTTVKYSVKGSAIPGFDFATLSGKIKIKPGHTSATITVDPIDEGITDGSVVAVKVALQDGNGYTVGTSRTAKVKITDND